MKSFNKEGQLTKKDNKKMYRVTSYELRVTRMRSVLMRFLTSLRSFGMTGVFWGKGAVSKAKILYHKGHKGFSQRTQSIVKQHIIFVSFVLASCSLWFKRLLRQPLLSSRILSFRAQRGIPSFLPALPNCTNVIAGLTRNPLRVMFTLFTAFLLCSAATIHAQPCAPITTVSISSPDAKATTVIKQMERSGVWKNPADATITFTATATDGDPATDYEWYVDGMLQLGETASSFVFITPTVVGFYSVYAAAINECTKSNMARSIEMMVIVTKKRCPLTQPNPSPITRSLSCPGNISINLAAATGTDCSTTITYQWEQSDDDASWTKAPGGTNANYTITVWEDIARYYRRKAIGDYGFITSASALVTVTVLPIRPLPIFMDYNLGATYIPTNQKDLMAKYASKTWTYDEIDIWGKWYQWGRYPDGYEARNSGAMGWSSAITYNDPGNGQIASTSPGFGIFVANATDMLYNWRGPSGNTRHDLWGNGEPISTPTPGGGVDYNGNYYQSTSWVIPANNPCPPTYRIPTQDEWELLGLYDCNPTTSAGVLYINNSNGYSVSTGLTWVPVRCNSTDGKCYNDNSNWATITTTAGTNVGGYAIYHTNEWNSWYTTPGTYDLLDVNAPVPYLFLPAAGARAAKSGEYSGVGNSGYYWCSSIPGGDAYSFYTSFGSGSAHPGNRDGYNNRATGGSVRCVKE